MHAVKHRGAVHAVRAAPVHLTHICACHAARVEPRCCCCRSPCQLKRTRLNGQAPPSRTQRVGALLILAGRTRDVRVTVRLSGRALWQSRALPNIQTEQASVGMNEVMGPRRMAQDEHH